MYNNKMVYIIRSLKHKHYQPHKQHYIQQGGVDIKKIVFLAAATILKLVGNVASIDSVKEIRNNLSQQPEYIDLNASLQETFVDLYGDARCNPSDMVRYEIKRDVAYEQTKILTANAHSQNPKSLFQPAGTMSAIDNVDEYTPAMWNVPEQSRGTSIVQPQQIHHRQPINKKRKHRKNTTQKITNVEKQSSPPNPFAIFEENKFKFNPLKNIIRT